MSRTMDPRRMGGVARLFGEEGARRLADAHVTVVGLGGVGSWAVEALVRSGVGRLTLIDGDTVDASNTNRQLPALDPEYGRPKAEVLAQRCRRINPDCEVTAVVSFVTPENAATLVPVSDRVLDCIDDLRAKAALCAAMHERGQAMVVAGGAGGKVDPSFVTTDDLARAKGDALTAKLRTILRKEYGFPKGSADGRSVRFGIPCVYSPEPLRQPDAENIQAIGAAPSARIGFGSSVAVTATVGLRAASLVVNAIAFAGESR